LYKLLYYRIFLNSLGRFYNPRDTLKRHIVDNLSKHERIHEEFVANTLSHWTIWYNLLDDSFDDNKYMKKRSNELISM